jgi:hypothetical protein
VQRRPGFAPAIRWSLVVSTDGLAELVSRGALLRLAPDAIAIADESLALPGDRTSTRLPLRRKFSPESAALGAVAALVERTGWLERESLLAAVELLGGRGAEAARKVLRA